MSEPAPLKPAYLMLGSDRPKVRRAVLRLRQRVIDESGSDINISSFDIESGRPEDVLQEVLDACEMPGFALGTRLILVANAHVLRVKQRGRLAACAANLLPDTCLAVEALKLPKDDALFKAINAVGSVLVWELPKKYEMAEWAQGRAKANRLPLRKDAAKHLLKVCGDDPQHAERLEREIEKLAVYCRGEVATEQDIDAVCTPDDEARIFDLMDAVGHRDRSRAFALLEIIFASTNAQEDAGRVLAMLVRHVRLLNAASRLECNDSATAAKELTEALGASVHAFTARKVLEQRRHYDRRRLNRALRALAAAQLGMRGRAPATLETEAGVNHTDRLVLELALARILAE